MKETTTIQLFCKLKNKRIHHFANFLARDNSGDIYAYQNCPQLISSTYYGNSCGIQWLVFRDNEIDKELSNFKKKSIMSMDKFKKIL